MQDEVFRLFWLYELRSTEFKEAFSLFDKGKVAKAIRLPDVIV